MDETHKCKLCSKDFANGKALGGHMRSHMLYHKSGVTVYQQNKNENGKRDYSPSSSEENAIYRRESKRLRRSDGDGDGDDDLSSISDTTTPEENVAHCLMKLSRDTWPKNEGDVEISDVSGDSVAVKAKQSTKKVRGKYGCTTCGRVFRSYQALGGHMASHRKVKAAAVETSAEEEVEEEEKIYECPFCDRVFPSGQALGGHKRSHVVGATAISRNAGAAAAIKPLRDIDLNLPAQDT